MKLTLFPFQLLALDNLRIKTREAQQAYSATHNQQVISFTAPTGAGKTIIVSAFMENVYHGDQHQVAQPTATFIWLSDSPELNAQSRLKIETKADKIAFNQCITVTDESFDQEVFDDGKIYFLNTQKLGANSNLTKHSDERQYTIWETLRNSARQKGSRLILIIDEAHRGSQSTGSDKALTIMQKFIKGSPEDGFLPMPIVLGMSATLERFNKLVRGTSSTRRSVEVTPEEVRNSGLLKDRIVISYSEETSSNKDIAVLQAAAEDWIEKRKHWEQYCQEEGIEQVNPIFVVQVENGSDNKISNTDLDLCLRKIEERTGNHFQKGEVFHTFGQTDAAIKISGLEVPFIEPSSINDNKQAKLVFFKENLSTGWDCPRAETMMSFRRARDATYIAQLLGRMVRTPLHRRIPTDEILNNVRLFLPYFEKETVQDVVKALHSSEGDAIPSEIDSENIQDKERQTLTIRPKRQTKRQRPKAHEPLPGQISMDDDFQKDSSSDTPKDSAEQTTSEELTNNGEKKAVTAPANLSATETKDSGYSFTGDKEPLPSTRSAGENSAPNPASQPETKELQPELDAPANQEDRLDREAIVKAINDMGLLTYTVSSRRVNNYLKSLFALTRLLVQTGIDKNASNDVHGEIVQRIHDYIESLKGTDQYEEMVESIKQFTLSTETFDVFGRKFDDVPIQRSFFITDADVDKDFAKAEIDLGSEGIANKYVKKYDNGENLLELKIDVILFTQDKSELEKLHDWAKTKFQNLDDKHRRDMIDLDDKDRHQYDNIVVNSDKVTKNNYRLPEIINVVFDKDGDRYTKHLYVNDDGYATFVLNNWEKGVLKEESQRPDFVCWIRNVERAQWALRVPYELDGSTKITYPDFLIIRHDRPDRGGYVVDLLEPHSKDYSDNLAKAKGFAAYAEENPAVGRLQLIRLIKVGSGRKRFSRLDLTKRAIREEVRKARSEEELTQLFNIYGEFDDNQKRESDVNER